MPVTPGDGGDNHYNQAQIGGLRAQAAPMVDTQSAWKGTVNGVRIGERDGIISSSGGKEWNTKNLGGRLAVDAACAATAGGLVAPVITMIDK